MSNAFLIDYQWCTGCHACEIACQMLHDLPPEQFGVKLSTVGPYQYGEDQWEFQNIPFFTAQCTQCASRQAAGKVPSCVQHCQAQCLQYGPLDRMVEKLRDNPHQILQVM